MRFGICPQTMRSQKKRVVSPCGQTSRSDDKNGRAFHAEVSTAASADPDGGVKCGVGAMLSSEPDDAGREVPARKEAQEGETGRIVLFPTRISPAKGKTRQKEIGKADQADAGVAD